MHTYIHIHCLSETVTGTTLLLSCSKVVEQAGQGHLGVPEE